MGGGGLHGRPASAYATIFPQNTTHKLCYNVPKEETMMTQQPKPLVSVKNKQPKTKKKSRAITSQDSILHIIGIGSSQGPTDISSDKHRYLADAAGDLHNQ